LKWVLGSGLRELFEAPIFNLERGAGRAVVEVAAGRYYKRYIFIAMDPASAEPTR